MGMSASQARFLGLTARKTNIEYEGQQINQERTSLSNQTASYYTQLLGLGVPTPPSVDQFTKQVYSWQAIGGTTNTILQMVKDTRTSAGDNDYIVRYTYNQDVIAAISNGVGRITDDGQTPPRYYANGYELALVAPTALQVGTTAYEEWVAIQKELGHPNPNTNNSTTYEAVYMYTHESSSAGDTNIYLKASEVIAPNNNYAEMFRVGEVTEREEEETEAFIRFDTDGKPVAIMPANYSNELALSASSVKDEDAYDTAMNKYEMEKYQYNKDMEDINAKIAIIQEQDRNLELRLKQLDTEQKAVSTEMDAVQKVIQKNVESTFKIFSA